MELTWEEWKVQRAQLRRSMGVSGWALLAYFLITNVAFVYCMLIETAFDMIPHIIRGRFFAFGQELTKAAESGWGYFLGAAIGFGILLLWKKPQYLRQEVFVRNGLMNVRSFLLILCVFLGCQLASQLLIVGAEMLLNLCGLSVAVGLEALNTDPDNISLVLYGCLLAPVTEELLFRGLVLRSLMPYGKRLAIFLSALTFGLFHGNLIQAPFAFLVGLVLGYVATEYSVIWSMVLHLINNLVMGEMLTRLTMDLPVELANTIFWAVFLFFGIAALVILVVNRFSIRHWRRADPIHRVFLSCYFTGWGNILYLLLMILVTLQTMFFMIAPI